MNEPQLRFDGFDKEWETKRLNEVLTLFGGNAFQSKDATSSGVRWLKIANVSLGKIFWGETSFLPFKFIEEYKKYLLLEGDIVMALTRPIINGGLKIAIISGGDSPSLLNQRVAKLICRENINDKFVYHLLRQRKVGAEIESLISGTDPPNIGNGEMKKIMIFIPSKIEQRKIANFLTLMDNKIEKQQEKIEKLEHFKKGMMQKVFSQEIRFKNHDGREYPEWEEKPLSDITKRIVRKNKGLQSTRPLTISAQHGLVDQKEYFNKNVASSNIEGYYLLEKGEFAYNKSYSRGYPLGAIKRLNDYDNGVLSTLYICFEPLKNISSDFLSLYFDSTFWHKEVSMISVEGARNHGLLNVGVNDFFNTKHKIPCLEEQIKISNTLTQFNLKVKKEKEKLSSLSQLKKGFMQQMFV